MSYTRSDYVSRAKREDEFHNLRRIATHDVLLRQFINKHCPKTGTTSMIDPSEPLSDIMARLERLITAQPNDISRKAA